MNVPKTLSIGPTTVDPSPSDENATSCCNGVILHRPRWTVSQT